MSALVLGEAFFVLISKFKLEKAPLISLEKNFSIPQKKS